MIIIKTIIDGLNINYIEEGEGEAVLIIPGWGTVINTYISLINSISLYSKVYCLDMPGFGKSQEPTEAWNVDKYVDFIIKFIESQSIKKLNLIGHSNGGRIIIKLMSSHKLKAKIDKIVLIGSAGIVNKKTFKQKFKVKVFKICKKIAFAKPVRKVFPNALENLKNHFGSADYKNASPIMRDTMVRLINEDLRSYLCNISSPTLLIWGEDDKDTPIENAYIMEKMIPDAGLVKFAGCSHYVFLERIEQVNKIIQTFFEGEN